MSSPAAGGVVELWLPARAALTPTVRTMTTDLAARAGFDVDAVSDLRMERRCGLLSGRWTMTGAE